jgi:hypothetical protein
MRLNKLIFGNNFDEQLFVELIPPSVKELEFGHNFNHSINGFLPLQLEHLMLGYMFNQPLNSCTFPETLRDLYFEHSFNHPLSFRILPKNLRLLSLSNDFDQVDLVLPQNLDDLFLNYLTEQKIMKQIINIRNINLKNYWSSYEFNELLTEHSLPDTIKSINMDWNYNKPISKKSLPANLYFLGLGPAFRQPIMLKDLPESLQILGISRQYRLPLNYLEEKFKICRCYN